MRYLLACFVFTACAVSPVQKEWNDKYDPANWRRQF